MRAIGMLVCITGCFSAFTATSPEQSPFFNVPVGAVVMLMREVDVPGGQNQVHFQGGRAMVWYEVNIYLPYCALNVTDRREAAQPVYPDRFTVTESYDERFFQQVRGPGGSPGPQAAAFDAPSMADLRPDGGMDYNVEAMVMALRSERQPQVEALICADWGLPQETRHITLEKIRRALGAFFRFEMPTGGENAAAQ